MTAYRGWSSGAGAQALAVGVIGWIVAAIFLMVFLSFGGGR